MTAFLRQIRRGEIDRNVGPRKAQTDSMERIPHTLTTFRDGLVRQTDDGKDVLSGADPDFHLNRARLDTDERQRGNTPVHAVPRVSPDFLSGEVKGGGRRPSRT